MATSQVIRTLEFGCVPIRKTHTEGWHIKNIELSGYLNAEIKCDYKTNQPFAVIYDSNWKEV